MILDAQSGVKYAIVGPTGIGKTAAAVCLAPLIDAEILSADSMQVYRHMDLGTAKPTPDELAAARFHLVDVAEPDQEWTLADFQSAAEAARQEVLGRGKLPLIVGGTGLYVRAITSQLDIPTVPPDEEFRAEKRAFAEANGNEALHAELARIDPTAAARIHVNDVKRIVRALEVFHVQGETISDLHARNQETARHDPVVIVGMNYGDRRALYARIDSRVDQMVKAGFVEEVRSLLDRGYSADLKPMQALGYRHMARYLAGETNFDDAVLEMKQDTRHFARRQLIWFRGDARVQWIEVDGLGVDEIARRIEAIFKNTVS
ncbi:tRNA dimethylallyltransferase [Capsulimonas corticalis]|uniref:tRNA dimethylallyltransferase n=1 Tax=Capsulimonas corticalis TaxID=2219043 RepID=A0A402D0W3_9BACT|nr:tRNA (adenosine(37)-N6)-dimethylallyltransferase MiaA [Capsulimonas corticalis]BDI31759.1 tRNA dimethylallyltransferase [Capsulimonas corticalis]